MSKPNMLPNSSIVKIFAVGCLRLPAQFDSFCFCFRSGHLSPHVSTCLHMSPHVPHVSTCLHMVFFTWLLNCLFQLVPGWGVPQGWLLGHLDPANWRGPCGMWNAGNAMGPDRDEPHEKPRPSGSPSCSWAKLAVNSVGKKQTCVVERRWDCSHRCPGVKAWGACRTCAARAFSVSLQNLQDQRDSKARCVGATSAQYSAQYSAQRVHRASEWRKPNPWSNPSCSPSWRRWCIPCSQCNGCSEKQSAEDFGIASFTSRRWFSRCSRGPGPWRPSCPWCTRCKVRKRTRGSERVAEISRSNRHRKTSEVWRQTDTRAGRSDGPVGIRSRRELVGSSINRGSHRS